MIRQRKSEWARLEAYLKRIEHNHIESLSQSELVDFGRLYRSTTSDLAIAQRDFPQKDVAAYLNQLVGRAHPVVYRGEPLVWRRLVRFYRYGLPQLFREMLPFIAVAALLLFVPAIIAYFVVLAFPDGARYVLSPAIREEIKSGTQWWKDLNEANQVGASVIMTNNLRVSLLAVTGGLLFGVLTVLVLVANGLDLGMVMGLLQYYGHAGPLWEFVAGHGVLELSEIAIAGGCGLLMGYALFRPGLLARRDALAIAASKSIRLLLGTAPLLIIAGTIEGMISPSDVIPAPVKIGVGVLSGILLYSYLFLAGRKPR